MAAVYQRTLFKLSICIATLNRATAIGALLDSIVCQASNDCEIVVLDSSSNDDTERVVAGYSRCFEGLRYVRQTTANGLDCDFDRAVGLARGEYCWLVPDDDRLKDGAVASVLEALRRNYSVVIVNVEIVDVARSFVVFSRWSCFDSDRVYGSGETERLYREVGGVVWYIGSVIVKRSIWLERQRERYYGSLHIHVGIIFQEGLPGETLLLAKPLISHRVGIRSWRSRATEMLLRWPSFVNSLSISESARRELRVNMSATTLKSALRLRAYGWLDPTDYRNKRGSHPHSVRERMVITLVSIIPGVATHLLYLLYYSAIGRLYHSEMERSMTMLMLRNSQFYFRNWGIFRK